MSRYMSSRFDGLEAYVPGEQPQDKRYVKLNTNESPFPPSPEVLSAVNAAETAQPLPRPGGPAPAGKAGGPVRGQAGADFSGKRLRRAAGLRLYGLL